MVGKKTVPKALEKGSHSSCNIGVKNGRSRTNSSRSLAVLDQAIGRLPEIKEDDETARPDQQTIPQLMAQLQLQQPQQQTHAMPVFYYTPGGPSTAHGTPAYLAYQLPSSQPHQSTQYGYSQQYEYNGEAFHFDPSQQQFYMQQPYVTPAQQHQPQTTQTHQHQPAISTGLRSSAAANASFMSNAELDYFEHFLGGSISPNDILGHHTQNQQHFDFTDGIVEPQSIMMNPIGVNTGTDRTTEGKKEIPIAPSTGSSFSNLRMNPNSGNASQMLINRLYSPLTGTNGTGLSTQSLSHSQQTNRMLQDKDTKRAHHIASEHKRRFRIRNELMRLNDLVPGLAGSTKNSQSKILMGAADYLERVCGENERLRAELEALKGSQEEKVE